MLTRLKNAVLGCFACFALAFALASAAHASSGPGGGDDSDDDRDTQDNDSSPDDDGASDDSSDDSSSGDDSSGAEDGGEGGDDSSGGEGGDDSSGGEGGDDSSGGEGSDGSSGGEGSNSGSGDGGEGSSGGEGSNSGSGHGGEGNSGQSANSGRGSVDDDDIVTVGRNDAGERVREGEAVVLTSRSDFSGRLASQGFRLVESFRVETIGASAMRIAVPKGMSERDALNALQALDPKGIVTFNHIYNPAAAGTAGATVRSASAKKPVKAKVGLVDAGIDAKHPMLKQVVVNTRSFDPLTNARGDSHGTAVASLIAGVSPGATVFAANVFTTSADGQEIATADAIVRGLDWLASMHVAVINLSLTGPANPILEAMIGRLNAAGHVLVAAVGNEGPRGAPQFPAAYDKVVGVTAVDGKNRVYLYANQGEYVDFAAHGVDLRVADPRGTVNTVSGTSYAAPVVAARLAAYLEVPDVALAAKAVEALAAEARDLGAPGRDPVFGHGLIGD